MVDQASADEKIVAVTQARMSSTRLPGKSLMTMAGRPMLQLILQRLRDPFGEVVHVVATSSDSSDDAIARLCERLDVPCVRGELQDVLARYVRALDRFEPDVAIRLTGDNPLLDGAAVRAGLAAWEDRDSTESIGVCNHLADRRDPLGYCVEVFEPDALRRAHRGDRTPGEREHVTLAFKREGLYESFRILDRNLRSMRWTVDTEEDFAYMSRLFEDLGAEATASEAVVWCDDHPHPGDLDEDGYYRE